MNENNPCPVSAAVDRRENIEWSISYAFHVTDGDKTLPRVLLVWTTSTPLTDPGKTAKAAELNAAGADVVARLGGIATNDLFALLDPLDRETFWCDTYHHTPEARAMEARQVADCVLDAIGVRFAPRKERGKGD